MISTRVHAAIDYAFPALIAALSGAPTRGRGTRRLMRAVPAWNYGYSALTRYEGGLVPVIGMPTHLALDTAGALAFLGGAALMRREPARERWLLAGLGLAQLAVIAASDARPAPARAR
jgi:hypothetical protein